MKRQIIHLLILTSLLAQTFSISAQSGGNFEIKQSVVASGGGTTSGGTFALEGTIGQPVAGGLLFGGNYSISSGYNQPSNSQCVYSLSSLNVATSPAASISAPIQVTTAQGCAWAATSSVNWIGINSGASGIGNGSVTLAFAANSGSIRYGTVTIAGQEFTVSQAALQQSFEGDAASRPHGDGVIQSNDVTQVQRFEIGIDQPNQSNEFQRADSAPLATRGDGVIQAADTLQAQRYEIGLNAPQPVGGPTSGANTLAEIEKLDEATETAVPIETKRELRVESAAGVGGQQIAVNVLANAEGDESGYGLTLAYNEQALTNPVVSAGAAGGARNCNLTAPGEIRCSVKDFQDNNAASSTDQIGEIGAGDNQILVRLIFTIRPGAASATTALTLSNVNAANDSAQSLLIKSQNGALTIIGSTTASVFVSGKVVTADGRGIRNVSVTMIDSQNVTRTTQTTNFGYYRFDDVAAGETVTITAKAKRFSFAVPSLFRTVDKQITDADFVAEQQSAPK